jgi:hypothetical protein
MEDCLTQDITRIFNDIEKGRDVIKYQANIALFSGTTQVEPTNFEQAWDQNVPKNRGKTEDGD